MCNAELPVTRGSLYTLAMAKGIVAVSEWEEVGIKVLVTASLVTVVAMDVSPPPCAIVVC